MLLGHGCIMNSRSAKLSSVFASTFAASWRRGCLYSVDPSYFALPLHDVSSNCIFTTATGIPNPGDAPPDEADCPPHPRRTGRFRHRQPVSDLPENSRLVRQVPPARLRATRPVTQCVADPLPCCQTHPRRFGHMDRSPARCRRAAGQNTPAPNHPTKPVQHREPGRTIHEAHAGQKRGVRGVRQSRMACSSPDSTRVFRWTQ